MALVTSSEAFFNSIEKISTLGKNNALMIYLPKNIFYSVYLTHPVLVVFMRALVEAFMAKHTCGISCTVPKKESPLKD